MTDTTRPDFEGFARAMLTEWPTGDIEGGDLFEWALQYGMIREIPGGYDPDLHIDSEGMCPEKGDPWYEYTFGGKDGPGLFSLTELRADLARMTRHAEALEAARDKAEARAESARADALRAVASRLRIFGDMGGHAIVQDMIDQPQPAPTPDRDRALDEIAKGVGDE